MNSTLLTLTAAGSWLGSVTIFEGASAGACESPGAKALRSNAMISVPRTSCIPEDYSSPLIGKTWAFRERSPVTISSNDRSFARQAHRQIAQSGHRGSGRRRVRADHQYPDI